MKWFLPALFATVLAACGGEATHAVDSEASASGHADTTHPVATDDAHTGDSLHESRPVLPHQVGGASASFLPSVAVPEPQASAAVRPPGAPIARAPARPIVVQTPAVPHEVVVMPSPSILSGLDVQAPLVTVRRIVWRLALGIAILLGVHTLIARARRRLPKLQDDLLLLQLASVVTVLALTGLAVVRAIERSSPLMAGASLVAVGLVAVWFGVRFLPRYIEGLYLVLGPTVRIGDWVALESDSGMLAEVGLVRLTLVREDGRRFSIPVAALGGTRFSVQPRDHSAPVDMVVPVGENPQRLRRQMLAAAQISPYRDPDTPVSATLNGDSLRVHFVAWSPDVVEHAVRHLRGVRGRLDAR